jgi:hypothetical protein
MTRSSVGIVGALVLLAPFGARGADVLTQHNDNARSGANTAETALTTKNVAPDKFGKLWTLYADGQVVAQPLYVSKLAIGDATVNAVIVATMHNTVYAYDADQEKAGPDGKTTPLWARWLGEPRPGDKHAIDMWSTNDPEWGVVSTPVIDAARTTLWLTSWHKEGNSYKLHALDLKTGQDRVPPVQIGGAPVAANKPCEYPEDFNPCTEKQRAGLLLQDNVVYVGFGGTDNQPPRGGLQPGGHYAHGSLFAFDATNLHQLAHWVTTPAGINGGIWGSGQGPAADKDGNVYVVTGNGTFTANNNGKDYGNSFVKVKLENGALAVKSSFTPCNQQWLDGLDLDLGSAGAMLVPNTNLLLGGGKEGVLYLLSRNALGGYAAGPGGPGCANPNVVQAFMATGLHDHGAGVMYGHIHSAPVYWKGPGGARVYVWGENDRLKAFAFSGAKFTNTANPVKSVYQPPMGMPGGMLSVSSNGAKAQTGIVWAAVPLNGDANAFRGVQGVLVAMDAQDISRQLWTSELGGARDRLGLFAKFVPPTIAGGKVFVATYGDAEPLQRYGGDAHPPRFPAKYYVAVYGLLEAHQHPAGTIVNQEEDDVAVLKAVAVTPLSLDPRTCAPADAGNVDCTAALAQKFGAPAFHTLIVPANYNFAGCSAMTVTTASKQPALATSTGIGWYASDATAADQAMTSGRFVPTAELKQVGAGTLKVGGPALLHQFVGVANCTVGAGSYDKVFKPFMQFENSPDGKVFRNWARAQNFRITRAAPTIDNTAQILQ